MILFTILTIMILLLVLLAVAILSVGGTVFVVIFADLIVCVAIIVLIMRYFRNRKNKK